MIQLLDQNTIDKIAAGEVIERPAAVVKELVENAIDSGATAITIEIKKGGISFIRITDNGCGILRSEIPLAFTRHATSKIKSVEDLFQIKSLGFRGEALSSIAAVSQVELITKNENSIIGCRYEVHGGVEITNEEIGCPDGTTFIMRNLFYNTPAREKFLKTAATEGGYISEIVGHFTLSHPEIRFRFIWDGKTKIQTSGNRNVKDILFHQYGSDIIKALLPVDETMHGMTLTGYIGKPELSRGTRAFMNYFINGRYIKSQVIQKAIESAYHGFTMTNRFPFTSLFLTIDSSNLDVNVHPTKMEVRFSNQEEVFELFESKLHEILKKATLIPEATLDQYKPQKKTDFSQPKAPLQHPAPEPFETNRIIKEDVKKQPAAPSIPIEKPTISSTDASANAFTDIHTQHPKINYEQQSLFSEQLVKEEDYIEFRLIGQVFDTYWMIEYGNEMLIIDQHAAHEKVLYEKIMQELNENHVYSQNLVSPIVLTLTEREKEVLNKYIDEFTRFGFEIEEFGGDEYIIKAVPSHFLHLTTKQLFYSILDGLLENPLSGKNETVTDRCATIACKAAVKGNNTLSFAEAKQLIDEMLHAKEPYHCPHGRPTTIRMNKKEFEKKFKRIV